MQRCDNLSNTWRAVFCVTICLLARASLTIRVAAKALPFFAPKWAHYPLQKWCQRYTVPFFKWYIQVLRSMRGERAGKPVFR